jgi:hypothetical protein
MPTPIPPIKAVVSVGYAYPRVALKKGDRLPILAASIVSAAGAVDLSGAVVLVRWWPTCCGCQEPQASSVQERTATIYDAARGVVTYAWQAGDTDTVGTYSLEWRVIYPGQVQMTAPADSSVELVIY